VTKLRKDEVSEVRKEMARRKKLLLGLGLGAGIGAGSGAAIGQIISARTCGEDDCEIFPMLGSLIGLSASSRHRVCCWAFG